LTSACATRRPEPAAQVAPQPTPTVAPRADGLRTFEIRALDNGLRSADEIAAGRVAITLRNEARQQRNAQFFRVRDDVTLVQVAAAFQKDPRSVVDLVTFSGGPGTVPPGGTQEVVQDLVEGQYVMATLLLSEAGQQYVPTGVFKTFKVTANTAATTPAPLPGNEEIVLADFAFGIPQLAAGQHTLQLNNVGKEPHEILVKRLDEGRTLADALTFVLRPVGTPPYGDAGGLLVFPGGERTALTLDLQPGPYVAICYFRDAATGKSHAELGMIRDFTIT
jgi:hypothetical protein